MAPARRATSIVGCMALGLVQGLAGATCVSAQASDFMDPRWVLTGEAGAVLGGRWLNGTAGPRLTSAAGSRVALGVHRALAPAVDMGVTLGVSAQPLRFQEGGARWDGGTLTDVQTMATLAAGIWSRGRWQADAEAEAGLSILSGARRLTPFASASSLLPAAGAGVALYRLTAQDMERRERPIGVVAHLGVTRLDPGQVDQAWTQAGWIWRLIVGVRVQR